MSTAVNPSAAKAPNAPNISPSAESEFNDTPYGLGPVWEVVVGYSLIEAALWTAGDLRQVWSIATVVWIVGLIVYRGQSLRELGLDWTAPLHSLWVIPAAAMISGAMLFGGHLAGTLHPYVVNRGFFSAALGYLFWRCSRNSCCSRSSSIAWNERWEAAMQYGSRLAFSL